jgi:hypothetical protein
LSIKLQEVLFESHEFRFVKEAHNEKTLFIYTKRVDTFGNTFWQLEGNRDTSAKGTDLAGRCLKELIGILIAAKVQVKS